MIFARSKGRLAEATESPSDSAARLHGTVAWWTARAQEANEAHDVEGAIEALRSGLEAARTLRAHLTGQRA